MNKSQLETAAFNHGLDLVGYTTCEQLDARIGAGRKPSDISEYLPGFVVAGKRIPAGLAGARDGEPKPIAVAIVHRALEEGVAALAYDLEARDYLAVVVPPLAMDFDKTTELSVTPAGQASPLIRAAAVDAGLGTLGLNGMVLTPQFGPRVLLGGLMTSLQLEPGLALAEELCPGLEQCGRCAAICPGRAIPTEAVRNRPLDEVRGLDEAACAEHSQPYGVGTFASHIRRLVRDPDPEAVRARIDGATTALLWYHMAFLRHGAFSGCTRCMQVCPVGKDFEMVEVSPYRRADLPDDFGPQIEQDRVTVEWLGSRDSEKEQH